MTKAEYLIRYKLPHCSKCKQILISTCDRSKPSKLTEFKGGKWTETKPQFMMLYPTAEKQSKLCPFCEDRLWKERMKVKKRKEKN